MFVHLLAKRLNVTWRLFEILISQKDMDSTNVWSDWLMETFLLSTFSTVRRMEKMCCFFCGFFCKLCLIFELLLSLYLFSSYKPNIVSWIKYISLIFSVKLLLHELLVWGQNVCKMNPNTILRKGLMLIVLACLLIKLDHTSTMPVSFRSILAWI